MSVTGSQAGDPLKTRKNQQEQQPNSSLTAWRVIMKRLFFFRIACVLLWIICMIALYIEIFVHDIDSLSNIYVWSGLALLGLGGIITGTFLSLKAKGCSQQ